MQPDQEAISAWRGSAPFWEKHREIIRQMFAPVTRALVLKFGNAQFDVASADRLPFPAALTQ
jgi:hypothetical protein